MDGDTASAPADGAASPLASQGDTASSMSNLSLAAKEFVPGGVGGPPAPPGPPPAMPAAAVNAPAFVPGGGGNMTTGATPFVPDGGGGGGGGDAGTTLPDSDDLLGLTAHTPGDAGRGGGVTGGVTAPPPPPQYGGYGGPQHGGQHAPPPHYHHPPPHFYGRPAPPPPQYGGRGMMMGGPRSLYGGVGIRPPPPRPRGGPPSPLARGRGRGGPPPPASALGRARAAATAAADRLRAELAAHAALTLASAADAGGGESGLPASVGAYHSIFPLEDVATASTTPSPAFGVPTLLVKGVSADDGTPAALRRLDPRAAPPSADGAAAAAAAVAAWAPLAGHPNLAPPTSAFVSSDWGGAPALWLAADLFPGAVTLEDAHLRGPSAAPPTEDALWSYLTQLCAALRAAHTAGLALRPPCLAPSKVILAPPGRLRVTGLAVPALLAPLDARDPAALAAAQRADVAAVGRLALALACGGAAHASPEAAAAAVSPDVASLAAALAAAADGGRVATWHALAASLGGRLLAELDARVLTVDAVSSALAREAGAARALRALARLTAVVDRGDDSGDAHVAALFRDAVFHEAGPDGGPRLEWGPIAEALAKLDSGSRERLLLPSRDEGSLLVVTYADVRRCVDGAWRELQARAAAAAAAARGRM